MKAKSLDEITKELIDKRSAVDAEAKDLELKIEMQNSAIREHEREMAEASDAGNVGDYVGAKKEREAAADIRGMYESRLKKLTKAPLISESEYHATVDEIKHAMGAEVAEMTKEVNNEKKRFDPYYNDLKTDVEKTDNALNIAYSLCYVGEDPKDSNGHKAIPEKYHGHTNLMLELKQYTGHGQDRDF